MLSANHCRWPDVSNRSERVMCGVLTKEYPASMWRCPRVVLHHLADQSALRVKDGQSRTELGGEGEEVKLGPEPAVITALGFLDTMEMGLEGLLRLPRGAVNPLQLRPVLVAPPVGAGHACQLEVPQPVRRGHMGAAAQVHEPRPVAIGADPARIPTCFGHQLGVEAHDNLGDPLDDLALVGLVGEDLEAFGERVLLAHERLGLPDDRPHLRFDPAQVVLGKTGRVGQLEVVVEAVGDGRADCVTRARPEPEHRLGHDVRRRVAQHLAALVGVGGHDTDLGAVDEWLREIDQHAVEFGGHRGRSQPASYPGGEFRDRRAVGDTACGPVRQQDRDLAGHLNHSSCWRRVVALRKGLAYRPARTV